MESGVAPYVALNCAGVMNLRKFALFGSTVLATKAVSASLLRSGRDSGMVLTVLAGATPRSVSFGLMTRDWPGAGRASCAVESAPPASSAETIVVKRKFNVFSLMDMLGC